MISTLLSWSSLLSVCVAAATPVKPFDPSKPAAFFLAGDSTTAKQSSNGGGWGNGFLGTLKNGAVGTNFGVNGRTTASYRSGGYWANVTAATTQHVKAGYEVFVTIQFGHNDQKSTSGVSLSQYSHNLGVFAQEILALKAHPILVTPISRRDYDSHGKIVENLATQRNLTLQVASQNNVSAIDLNEASTNYLNAIGKANATSYNLVPSDTTHLNDAGSVVFGNLVSELVDEIKVYGTYLTNYTKPQDVIVDAIAKGQFYYPPS